MRSSDSTTSLPASVGICPPHRPVFPDCGTIIVRVSLAIARMRLTSCVEPGRSTRGERPVQICRHSRM